jgi:glycosyltransferase involved in cell wall biosynthesis
MSYGVGNHIKLFLKAIGDNSEIERILLIGPQCDLEEYPKVDAHILPVFGRYFFTKQPYFALAARKAIQEELLKDDFDAIHVHFPIIGKEFKVPLVSTFHTLNIQQSKVKYSTGLKSNVSQLAHRIFEIYDKSTMKYSKRSIFVSKTAMDLACEKYAQYRHKFISISNFVDTSRFTAMPSNKKEALSEKYGLDAEIQYFLFAGRLEPMKGVQQLVNAFRELNPPKNSKLLIVGEGPLKEKICSFEFVDYLGRIPYQQMQEIYNIASVFIMPSFYENFPLTILEAMSCALPVISSKVGDVEYILTDEKSLFPPDDYDMMKRKLKNFMAMSVDELEEIGRENQRTIVTHYGMDNATKLTNIYKDLN